MTKDKLEQILVEYGVQFTSALADRLLLEFNAGLCKDAISRSEAISLMTRVKHDTMWPDTAIDELERLPSIQLSVIKDIKAEIDKTYRESAKFNMDYAEGLEMAEIIIDKHISGKENNETAN